MGGFEKTNIQGCLGILTFVVIHACAEPIGQSEDSQSQAVTATSAKARSNQAICLYNAKLTPRCLDDKCESIQVKGCDAKISLAVTRPNQRTFYDTDSESKIELARGTPVLFTLASKNLSLNNVDLGTRIQLDFSVSCPQGWFGLWPWPYEHTSSMTLTSCDIYEKAKAAFVDQAAANFANGVFDQAALAPIEGEACTQQTPTTSQATKFTNYSTLVSVPDYAQGFEAEVTVVPGSCDGTEEGIPTRVWESE